MNRMTFKYGLDDVPPPVELLLLGLQWLAITVPTIIIIGKVVAELHFSHSQEQVVYIQKIFFVVSLSLFVQVLWGHRLPLIIGPAAVLLVGIVASRGSNISAVYTSILIGGAILFVLSITGLFSRLKVLFTPRVIATILILIAFTLTPMIMNLIINDTAPAAPLSNLFFALALVLCMFIAARHLGGLWKTTLILWAILAGSLVYYFFFPWSATAGLESTGVSSGFFTNLNLALTLDPGVLIAFLICFLALSINDLGSIQSIGELLQPDNMPQRITRGIALTGLANVMSGMFGVIGQVNFSLSPGVIVSTGCASRYTLLPTAAGLLALSFLPRAIAFMGSIPSVIIGSTLIYIMCSQIAAGLLVAFNSMRVFKFEYGLVIGLPLMLSIIISFLPINVLNTFPGFLRPVIGNGFVVGALSVLIMEHIIYKERPEKNVSP